MRLRILGEKAMKNQIDAGTLLILLLRKMDRVPNVYAVFLCLQPFGVHLSRCFPRLGVLVAAALDLRALLFQ